MSKIFFYGLFMDRALLTETGLHPGPSPRDATSGMPSQPPRERFGQSDARGLLGRVAIKVRFQRELTVRTSRD